MEFLKHNLDFFVFGILGTMSFIALALVLERYYFYAKIKLENYSEPHLLNVDLTKNLAGLSTIGANAPYIGLLGTVLGILIAFYEMGQATSLDANQIMLGLALALKATAAGLAVAIPAIMFYNIFQRKVDVRTSQWHALQNKHRN